MYNIHQRTIVSFLLISLFLTSCATGSPSAATVSSTLTSGAENTVLGSVSNNPGISTTTQLLIIDRTNKLTNSNQIVSPFLPTDVFIFALPDWNDPDGLEVAKKLHATVVGSCHQDIDWRLQMWLDEAGLLSKVTAIAHAAGLKYTSHFTVDRGNKDKSIPFEEDVAVRDIDGNIIPFSMPEEKDMRIWKSVHYPEWQDYMVNLAEKAVDAGVDILCIDGWTYNYDVIQLRGGDYSTNSLIGFKDYLKSKYDQKQLEYFGINDINTFDYREFKKSNTKAPLLDKDFEDFQLSSSHKFWQEIISKTKSYAESKGKTVLFTVNVNISEWETIPGLPIADAVDGFMSEYRFQPPPYKNTITDFKIFRSLGKPVVIIPNAGMSANFLQRTDLTELMKIYTAEAYASGEFIYPPYSVLVNSPKGWQFYNADMDKLYPYYDFFTSNKKLYENLYSAADIAVLFSYATLKGKLNGGAYSNFYGIGNLLLDIHRQFDVLFAGDNVWMKDTLTMDQLKQYQVIILPSVADISDKHLNLLLDYVKLGGTIFAFGATGVRTELGQPRDNTPLTDLLVEGAHLFGQGLFIYTSNNYGSIYLPKNDVITRQKVSDGLNALSTGYMETNASDKVSILEYWNTTSKASIIHLINQDYDTQAQRINQQLNISMSISLNKELLGKDLSIFYLSPDWTDPKELKYSLSENVISFTLPGLDTYGVIYIGDKNTFSED